MAVPPTIPTSFVPRPESARRSATFDLASAFSVVAVGILVITLLAAGAVGGYSWYLSGVQKSKDAAVATAEQSVDASTVQSFVQLSDQLTAAQGLISGHVMYSQFFTALDAVTLEHVSITELTVTTQTDNSAKLHVTGVAASFNALAAESAAIATNTHIQDAVFSDITIDKTGTVGFALDASLDSTLVVEPAAGPGNVTTAPAAAAPSSDLATTTAASTTTP